MADSALETVKGIITRLNAVAGVTSLVGSRIYTSTPQGVTYPFIRIGIDSQDESTKDFAGVRNIVRVQSFSRYDGMKEALQIRQAVETALNRQESNVTITGFNLIRLERATLATVFQEGDGKTWQSVIEFEAVTQ